MNPQEMLEAFGASRSGEIVLLFFVASLGVVGIVALVPIYYLNKLNSKELLMDSK